MIVNLWQNGQQYYPHAARQITCVHARYYAKESEGVDPTAPKRKYSDDQPLFIKMKNFFKRNKKQEVSLEEQDKEMKYNAEVQRIREYELEEKMAVVNKARNRSRLYYSDRNLIHNKLPQAGIEWQKNDVHQSKEFQSTMFARFGKATQFDPSVAWPTSDDVQLQKEYEHVLYDGLTLKEMIKNAKNEELERTNAVLKKEKEILEKFSKHEQEIASWQRRVEQRNVSAGKQEERRAQLFAEVIFYNIFFSHHLITYLKVCYHLTHRIHLCICMFLKNYIFLSNF